MASDPDDQWANVELDETFNRSRAGGSVAERARGLRTPEPVRTLLARFLGVPPEERAWRREASGERQISWWLGRFPTGWYAFRDPPADPGESIDHLVIGPAGVFTIHTENLTGKVWIGPKSVLHNRRRTDFLPKASALARGASVLLSAAVGRPVEARGVLAILADDWTIKQRPVDVHVAAPRGAKDWILRQPAILRPDEVIVLAVAASTSSTWSVV